MTWDVLVIVALVALVIGWSCGRSARRRDEIDEELRILESLNVGEVAFIERVGTATQSSLWVARRLCGDDDDEFDTDPAPFFREPSPVELN